MSLETFMAASPFFWGLIGFSVGAGLMVFAKAYRLIFKPRSRHRLGDTMTAKSASVIDWQGGEGYISADGELWRAKCDLTLAPGDAVSIAGMRGLVLTVKKQSDS